MTSTKPSGRGTFTCDGVQGVVCDVNMPDPPRNHTCKCAAGPPHPPHPPHPPPPPPSPVPSPPMSPKHCKGYLNEVQTKVSSISSTTHTRARAHRCPPCSTPQVTYRACAVFRATLRGGDAAERRWVGLVYSLFPRKRAGNNSPLLSMQDRLLGFTRAGGVFIRRPY